MKSLSITRNAPDFECTCDTSPSCADQPHCMCVYILEDDENSGACICTCWGDAIVLAKDVEVPDLAHKLGLYTTVKLSAKGVDLGMLAVFLNGICEAEILVSASRLADEPVVEITRAPLGEAIEQLGLVVRREAT